jgi:hypothetical protein
MEQHVMMRMMVLRRQILLHCYIYYGMNENIWEDHEWDKRARELHQLQQEHGWNIGFYDEIFKHWKGQSGYWLPTNKGNDEHIVRVAQRIVAYDKMLATKPDAVKTPLGHTSLLHDKEMREKEHTV